MDANFQTNEFSFAPMGVIRGPFGFVFSAR
jgi:hypothetical protein